MHLKELANKICNRRSCILKRSLYLLLRMTVQSLSWKGKFILSMLNRGSSEMPICRLHFYSPRPYFIFYLRVGVHIKYIRLGIHNLRDGMMALIMALGTNLCHL